MQKTYFVSHDYSYNDKLKVKLEGEKVVCVRANKRLVDRVVLLYDRRKFGPVFRISHISCIMCLPLSLSLFLPLRRFRESSFPQDLIFDTARLVQPDKQSFSTELRVVGFSPGVQKWPQQANSISCNRYWPASENFLVESSPSTMFILSLPLTLTLTLGKNLDFFHITFPLFRVYYLLFPPRHGNREKTWDFCNQHVLESEVLRLGILDFPYLFLSQKTELVKRLSWGLLSFT